MPETIGSATLTRRNLLRGAAAAAAVSGIGWADTPAGSAGWVLLGTQDGEGVYRARWNGTTGELGAAELAIATPRPSYIALHPRHRVLYACNELDGPAGTVSAFPIDRKTEALSSLSRQNTGGAPCFVSVDRTGKVLMTANYSGGSLSVFSVDSRGGIEGGDQGFSCAKSGLCGTPGPEHDRQDGPHLHCAVVSPDNRAVLACDLGDDAVLIFPLDPHAAAALGAPTRIAARAGSGPRHIVFHPAGDAFYCVHELDCTVDASHWAGAGSAAGAKLLPESVLHLASRSSDPALPNTGAEVAVSRDGRFLYASTRGADQLTVASIDTADHTKLSIVQQLSCEGRKPRFFALDPTGRWLLCANQDSSTITVFARDAQTGRLTPHGKHEAPSPMCIVWI